MKHGSLERVIYKQLKRHENQNFEIGLRHFHYKAQYIWIKLTDIKQ